MVSTTSTGSLSDLSDAEWKLVRPCSPHPPHVAGSVGPAESVEWHVIRVPHCPEVPNQPIAYPDGALSSNGLERLMAQGAPLSTVAVRFLGGSV